MNKDFAYRMLTCASAITLMGAPGAAHAYNGKTHQAIVNLSWQTMRAAVKGDLSKDSALTGTPIASQLARLDRVGDCALPASDPRNFCGRRLTQAEWDSYLLDIRASIQRLNELDPAIPNVQNKNNGCTGNPLTWTASRLGDFSRAISNSHLNNGDGYCEEFASSRTGVFADFEIPDDEQKNQGLVLGWHAEHRDDDSGDSWIDMNPLVTGTLAGQALLAADWAWEMAVGVILVPFVCAWQWLSGESCDPDDAKKLADDINPVDVLLGIIPGFKFEAASKEAIGMWHYLNMVPGRSNWYDDVQGLLYEEGGPGGEPSAVDMGIMLMGDVLFATIDHSNSAGAERYEITDDETHLPNPSEDRASWKWQAETLGHVHFSPVDNFALYGEQRFASPNALGDFSAEGLGWPLHALGDVTVPMHVVATTGWGHRPYEDYVNDNYGRLMFEECEVAGESGPSCDLDALKVAQVAHAREILQRAFRFHEFLKTHADVRDYITQVAGETYALVQSDPAFGRVFCDTCSLGYVMREDFPEPDFVNILTGLDQVQDFREPEAYYDISRNPRLFELERTLLTRSAAASLAYLMGAASRMTSACSALDQACTGDGSCCGAAVCGDDGQCCRDTVTRSACVDDAECCAGSCMAGRCCEAIPLHEQCTSDDDCCGGVCASNGRCLQRIDGTCAQDSDCVGDSVCQAGLCKRKVGESCLSDVDCSSALCRDGQCRIPNGGHCSLGSPCLPDALCDEGVCRGDEDSPCTGGGQCLPGLSCIHGECADPPPA
jgi:hypothetical protein